MDVHKARGARKRDEPQLGDARATRRSRRPNCVAPTTQQCASATLRSTNPATLRESVKRERARKIEEELCRRTTQRLQATLSPATSRLQQTAESAHATAQAALQQSDRTAQGATRDHKQVRGHLWSDTGQSAEFGIPRVCCFQAVSDSVRAHPIGAPLHTLFQSIRPKGLVALLPPGGAQVAWGSASRTCAEAFGLKVSLRTAPLSCAVTTDYGKDISGRSDLFRNIGVP